MSINGLGNTPEEHQYRTVMVALRSGQASVFAGSTPVLDLGEFGKRLEHPVDGILGWDFFQQWCTTLDYSAKHLILRPISDCAPPTEKHGTLTGKWSTNGLLLSSILTFPNERSAPAFLKVDTGCSATLILNTQFRAVAGLGESGPAATEATSWGMNGESSGDIVPFSNINFEGGKVQLNGNGETTIEIVRRGSFSKRNRDGVIGNGMLELMTWTFDPAAKRIYIEEAAPSNPSRTP